MLYVLMCILEHNIKCVYACVCLFVCVCVRVYVYACETDLPGLIFVKFCKD